jgi:hypothetical protein
MAAMTAKHYLAERGINAKAARFAGAFIAVREEPESTELVHKEGKKVVFTKWQPPKGAKMWTLWTTGGLGTEPYTDVWTVARGWGFAFSCCEWPSLAGHWTGGFKTEAAALKEAARIVKKESDEQNAA